MTKIELREKLNTCITEYSSRLVYSESMMNDKKLCADARLNACINIKLYNEVLDILEQLYNDVKELQTRTTNQQVIKLITIKMKEEESEKSLHALNYELWLYHLTRSQAYSDLLADITNMKGEIKSDTQGSNIKTDGGSP